MHQPKPLFDVRAEHGEGPLWDPVEGNLYWVDLFQGRYFKANLKEQTVEHHEVGQALGVMALRKKWGMVVAVENGFALWNEDARNLQIIKSTPISDEPALRFNDGAVDPAGRFFAGTMAWDEQSRLGKLYRLDANFVIKELDNNLYISNGMGWSMDRKTFYFIDTLQHAVFAYDYDLPSGDISNRRVFIRFAEDELPDGMTMDSNDGFWIALYGGGKIVRFDASGKRTGEIPLPVQHPTSCCFGGRDMKTLFITTSQKELSEDERRENPLAGRLFYLETDVRGKPERRFRG